MRAFICRLAVTAALVFVVNAAAAQDKIRIGLIYTLAGPASALGQQSKNGFELAHAIGLLENLAIDAACVQHKGRCQPANAAADDDRLHNPRPTPTTAGIMRLAGRRSNPTALQR